MLREKVAGLLRSLGIKPTRFYERLAQLSINASLIENGMGPLVKKLKSIVPDLSRQYSFGMEAFNDYASVKMRGMHAFQCSLMLTLIEGMGKRTLTVVDIGDSSGTHMLYLKELAKDKFHIDTISVNLDPRAIERIKARGLEAIYCRAEELDLGDKKIDLFTSFEMVEHLHNPVIFFRRLAKKSTCSRMLVTVPYLKKSRVGLYYIRTNSVKPISAEEEHIFELSPEDWSLLFKHAGWKVIHSKTYYQYPRKIPLLRSLLAAFWRATDLEGFWGAVLEKDTTASDLYQDWEE
ncbi:MAG: methyltransferase domain-containing protein [Candidatus Omnitrophica bacterium]|nr:methyltransferase domain-containing protein [Candidatus Omnitrophota bacterium]